MGDVILTMMACSNNSCHENFFVESEKEPACCAFCGEKTLYPTYTYQATPDPEELEKFASEVDVYENHHE